MKKTGVFFYIKQFQLSVVLPMNIRGVSLPKIRFAILLFLQLVSLCLCCTVGAVVQKERYNIIYLLSSDLERVLDYKDELDGVFDAELLRKIKVMGCGDQYALVFDGNDSAATVSKTLIEHGNILNKAGFDEPYATRELNFHRLYNVSYGIGPNLEPLKKRYDLLYNLFGGDIHSNLFIERTDYGNYVLVYRYRGRKAETAKIAKKHSRFLRKKRISASLAAENNNVIVYGESSLINDEAFLRTVTDKKTGKQAVATSRENLKKETKSGTGNVVRHIKAVVRAKKSTISTSPVMQTVPGYVRLEENIESYIGKLRRKRRILRDESTGWAVYDLVKNQMVVDINADRAFQAASMIKPFVALAFFHQVKAGKFKYGPKSRRKMAAMIQRSSNSATNWVMRQVGGPRICDAILRKYYSHIFQNTKIKEYIPPGGKTYLNSASPSDYVRFLRKLWDKKLPYSREIRRLMALPGRDRIYNGTPIPKGTLVYNKTGSTAHLCGDMGILVPKTKKGGRYPYIIVGVVERRSRPSNYGHWMDSRGKIIREVSTMVYKGMKKTHLLR